MSNVFQATTFTAPEARVKRLTERLAAWMPAAGLLPDHALQVLEIGCGTGRQSLSLAEALPNARLFGLDISAGNIREAERLAARHPAAQRLRFAQGDYLQAAPGSYDLILADSVFHLMGAQADAIFPKVARELKKGGLLVMTLPGDCAYNALLWSVRRVFRLARCRLLDETVLLAARLLHGGAYSAADLRERLPYMYHLPPFHYDKALGALLGSLGLRLLHAEAVPHGSLAQPKHQLLFYRKTED